MNKPMNRKQFLEVLFDADHISTCGYSNASATKPKPVFPDLITDRGTKFSINPIIDNRDTENVVKAGLYSMLFEMDKTPDGELIPRDEQIRLFKASGLPYSTMMWSGTKSVHVIVRLNETIPQLAHKPLWEAIERVLTKHGCCIDPKTSLIPQISRMPESMRKDPIENDKGERIGWTEPSKQDLIDVRTRIDLKQIGEWLKANGESVKKPEPPKPSNWTVGSNESIEDTEKWQAAYNMYKKKNGEFDPNATTGNWSNLINFSTYCYKVDLSLDSAMQLTVNKFGHSFVGTGHQFEINQPFTKGYTWCEKNAVDKIKLTSKEEYRKEKTKELFDNLLPEVEDVIPNKPKIPYDNLITNWWIIGSDIYLRYANRELEKQTVQGFNARFPQKEVSYTMIPNKRSGFGYYPDYFGDNDIPLPGNRYNAFKKPNVVIEQGKWPMTEVLIRHIFGDQYELGLEYYWVKRHRPTRALPALCLVGDEDAGKTTIGDHQRMCFSNAHTLQIKHLEGSDSAFLFGNQDIIIEESNAGGSNRMSNASAILSDIKTMVTQCGGKISCKRLHKDVSQVDYFAKVLMFTNDKTPIKMTGEATRFWVRNIFKAVKHDEFLERLEAEVGHFLWYLDNEFKPSRQQSKERLWFTTNEYWTIEKDLAKKHSGSNQSKAIKDALTQWFDTNDEQVCFFDLKSLKDYIEAELDYDFSKGDLKEALLEELQWPLNKRLSRTDSLTEAKNGLRVARKMSYWAIDSSLKSHQETNGMEKLLEL